jgi:hypothetical protein
VAHAPQLYGSRVRSTHAAEHAVFPDAHVVQAPEVQTSPEAQTVPQEPQLELSVIRLIEHAYVAFGQVP